MRQPCRATAPEEVEDLGPCSRGADASLSLPDSGYPHRALSPPSTWAWIPHCLLSSPWLLRGWRMSGSLEALRNGDSSLHCPQRLVRQIKASPPMDYQESPSRQADADGGVRAPQSGCRGLGWAAPPPPWQCLQSSAGAPHLPGQSPGDRESQGAGRTSEPRAELPWTEAGARLRTGVSLQTHGAAVSREPLLSCLLRSQGRSCPFVIHSLQPAVDSRAAGPHRLVVRATWAAESPHRDERDTEPRGKWTHTGSSGSKSTCPLPRHRCRRDLRTDGPRMPRELWTPLPGAQGSALGCPPLPKCPLLLISFLFPPNCPVVNDTCH